MPKQTANISKAMRLANDFGRSQHQIEEENKHLKRQVEKLETEAFSALKEKKNYLQGAMWMSKPIFCPSIISRKSDGRGREIQQGADRGAHRLR